MFKKITGVFSKLFNKAKPVDPAKREQLKDMFLALTAFSAVTLIPSIGLAGNIKFQSKVGATDTLYLSQDGKVGIRTTSPSKELEVNGEITATKVYNAVWN